MADTEGLGLIRVTYTDVSPYRRVECRRKPWETNSRSPECVECVRSFLDYEFRPLGILSRSIGHVATDALIKQIEVRLNGFPFPCPADAGKPSIWVHWVPEAGAVTVGFNGLVKPPRGVNE